MPDINAEALIQVYLRRPDLQAVYNPDGTARNPKDPRIAGIPNLRDWAMKYGINEEPSLTQAKPVISTPAPQRLEPAYPGINTDITSPNFGKRDTAYDVPSTPAYTPPQQSQPVNGNLTDAVFMQNALQMVYNRRSDLQALYKPDGTAKDPTDPRIAGIPTLQDWARQYGYNEDVRLAGFGPGATPAPTPTSTPVSAPTPAPSVLADPNFTTGVPELDNLYGELSTYIENLVASGQKVNPNIELTPEVIKEFVDQATAEVTPYYQNQIKIIREDLERSLTDLQKEYNFKKAQSEATFKQNLATARESLAGAGLAFSGVRGQQEQTMQETEQRALDYSAEAAASAAKNAAAAAEKVAGSRTLADLELPVLSQYTASLAGKGGYVPGRTLDFYSPSGRDVTGSLEYQERGDIRSLSDFFKQQEIQRRSLNFGG